MSSPSKQPQYQVRFDWGLAGAEAIAPGAHIVIWADALPTGTPNPQDISHAGAILTGSVGARNAIAAWVLARQLELGDRATVAVVAAGGPDGRFAVEDLLAAGAVIDALAEVGIDYISPEAAAAVAAFAGLRNAIGHVLSASVTGQELIAEHGRDHVVEQRKANESENFTVLREFTPVT